MRVEKAQDAEYGTCATGMSEYGTVLYSASCPVGSLLSLGFSLSLSLSLLIIAFY